MKIVYKNLKGNTDNSLSSILLSKAVVERGRGGQFATNIDVKTLSISNTSDSLAFVFDIYIRKFQGFVKNDQSGAYTSRSDNSSMRFSSYYIIKNATVPVGSTMFPLENNSIEFGVDYDLMICVKGAAAMTGDIILTYE
tara:strand:+ start:3604 stop:4020 length:417 start_codon:yes stop_codon:yes gene_type:complete